MIMRHGLKSIEYRNEGCTDGHSHLPILHGHLRPPITGAFRRLLYTSGNQMGLQRAKAENEKYIDSFVWKHT